ncbi:MAG: hypothetical protein M1829_002720 [Trizodia sp. TS-e1964]|nr:MAG: hypothetical protein M1829_002720 [Trizodia sp. TS-e1964]
MAPLTDVTASRKNATELSSATPAEKNQADGAFVQNENLNSPHPKAPRFMSPTIASRAQILGSQAQLQKGNTSKPSVGAVATSSNTKGRNWVASAVKRVGAGRSTDKGLRSNTKAASLTNNPDQSNDSNKLSPPVRPSTTSQRSTNNDKPLPSPPPEALTLNSASVEISRSLLDATEKPLKRSPNGREKGWPVLFPDRPTSPHTLQRMIARDELQRLPSGLGDIITYLDASLPTPIKAKTRAKIKNIPGDANLAAVEPTIKIKDFAQPRYSKSVSPYLTPPRTISPMNARHLPSKNKFPYKGVAEPTVSHPSFNQPLELSPNIVIPDDMSAGAAAIEKSAGEARNTTTPRQTRTSTLRAQISSGVMAAEGYSRHRAAGFMDSKATQNPLFKRTSYPRILDSGHEGQRSGSPNLSGQSQFIRQQNTTSLDQIRHKADSFIRQPEFSRSIKQSNDTSANPKVEAAMVPQSTSTGPSHTKDQDVNSYSVDSKGGSRGGASIARQTGNLAETLELGAVKKMAPAVVRHHRTSIPVFRGAVSSLVENCAIDSHQKPRNLNRFHPKDIYGDFITLLDLEEKANEIISEEKQDERDGFAIFSNEREQNNEKSGQERLDASQIIANASNEHCAINGPKLTISPEAENIIMGQPESDQENKARTQRQNKADELRRTVITNELRKASKEIEMRQAKKKKEHRHSNMNVLQARSNNERIVTGSDRAVFDDTPAFSESITYDSQAPMMAFGRNNGDQPDLAVPTTGEMSDPFTEKDSSFKNSSMITIKEGSLDSSYKVTLTSSQTSGETCLDKKGGAHLAKDISTPTKEAQAQGQDLSAARVDTLDEAKDSSNEVTKKAANTSFRRVSESSRTQVESPTPKSRRSGIRTTTDIKPVAVSTRNGRISTSSKHESIISRIPSRSITPLGSKPDTSRKTSESEPPARQFSKDFTEIQNKLGSARGLGSIPVDVEEKKRSRSPYVSPAPNNISSKSKMSFSNIRGMFRKKDESHKSFDKSSNNKKVLVSSAGSPLLDTEIQRQSFVKRLSLGLSASRSSRILIPGLPPTPRGEELVVSPARHDNHEIRETTELTMHILNLARTEVNSPRKARLLEMGKWMVDAITSARDAEQAMEQAKLAASNAQVSFMLTKKSVAAMAGLVKDWKNISDPRALLL